MTEKEEQALKSFLLDINCLKSLDKWTDEFNLFDVLGITNMEIRHSNLLAWLLDPNENHGLGEDFLFEFFSVIASKDLSTKRNSLRLLLQDFDSYQVYREANHMDLAIVSHEQKTVVIIENKIWSRESAHQLKDYYEKSKVEFKGYDCIYVFLTPDGHKASDPDNWISFSYRDILNSLDKSVHGKQLRPEIRLLIDNYMQTIRRNIMQEKNDELVKVCNTIYNKHRTALRLIFENINIGPSGDSELMRKALVALEAEGKIICDGGNKWQFHTPSMNDYLPALESPCSSWGTDWVYYYWFEKMESKLIIHLELGGWNLPPETKNRSNQLIKASGKKVSDFQYKRIYRKEEKLSQDNYEASFENAVFMLVNSALDNENKLLQYANSSNDPDPAQVFSCC